MYWSYISAQFVISVTVSWQHRNRKCCTELSAAFDTVNWINFLLLRRKFCLCISFVIQQCVIKLIQSEIFKILITIHVQISLP
jgi:hypothetical protein